jgi:hypothetical protein
MLRMTIGFILCSKLEQFNNKKINFLFQIDENFTAQQRGKIKDRDPETLQVNAQ